MEGGEKGDRFIYGCQAVAANCFNRFFIYDYDSANQKKSGVRPTLFTE